MKRTLFTLVAVVGLATAANAASITATADQGTYNFGETITLTIEMTVDPGAGDAAPNMQGTIGYDTALVGSPVVVNTDQAETFTGFSTIPWSIGGQQGTCNEVAGTCNHVDQIFGTGSAPFTNGPLFSTLTFVAGNTVGTANFDWTQLNYFGLAGPAPGGPLAGTSVEIVPEPTTAALLGLGLFGLALGGRRR